MKKGNLVAVVAANEWEAVQAAQAVAADTKPAVIAESCTALTRELLSLVAG